MPASRKTATKKHRDNRCRGALFLEFQSGKLLVGIQRKEKSKDGTIVFFDSRRTIINFNILRIFKTPKILILQNGRYFGNQFFSITSFFASSRFIYHLGLQHLFTLSSNFNLSYHICFCRFYWSLTRFGISAAMKHIFLGCGPVCGPLQGRIQDRWRCEEKTPFFKRRAAVAARSEAWRLRWQFFCKKNGRGERNPALSFANSLFQ